MNQLALLLLLPAALRGWQVAALADDDEHGHCDFDPHQYESKQTYVKGNCKVERKSKKNGVYKGKHKCKGPADGAYQAAPVDVYAAIFEGGSSGIAINGSATFFYAGWLLSARPPFRLRERQCAAIAPSGH